jgi:ribonucleoside-diphosphate reductase alpha chain
MTYAHDEALRASLAYFDGDELAAATFINKYALRDDKGELLELSPEDMHHRLAKEFARIESKYDCAMSESEIFLLFDHFHYVVPQGSPMSAIGNPYKVQSLSNCFVIAPPADSYGSIARADEEILQIQKRRGGVGIDISSLRPRGLPVKNAAGSSDGIGIFMERFSNTTREVAQGGRRGALMETIDVRHVDIETFIDIKRDPKRVTGANTSIKCTDEFMRAVEDDSEFTLRWPVDKSIEDARLTKVVKARDLWNKIVDAAWSNAEPGVLFWDNVLKYSMADEFADKGFSTICTNPCGELPLSEYSSCILLLLNALSYVVDPFTPQARFDYFKFAQHTWRAQRLIDDLVDLEIEAIERIIEKVMNDPEGDDEKHRELSMWQKILQTCRCGRRTGTGITAVGDTLAALGITYGSQESFDVVEQIYKTHEVSTHSSSVQMAKERGAFPAWEPGRYTDNEFAKRLASVCPADVNDDFAKFGRRNISLTTTPPAGTVSIETQTTSGIEAVTFLEGIRRCKTTPDDPNVSFVDELGDSWKEYKFVHHGLTSWMKASGKSDVSESPYHNATMNDVDWVASIDVMARAQKWCEHAISKTVNLPKNVSKQVVSDVYMKAWKLGIKGVTVYRDGCRSGVIVSDEHDDQPKTIVESHAPKRPKEVPCDIHRVTVKGESYLVLVGLFEKQPYEVFAGLQQRVEVPKKIKVGMLIKNGKKDGIVTYNLLIPVGDDDEFVFRDIVSLFDNPDYGALTRMASLSLRHGVPVHYLCEQLKKDRHSDLQSFSSVLARVLKTYIKDGTATAEKVCPECGAKLTYLQGCVTCSACGWSKC